MKNITYLLMIYCLLNSIVIYGQTDSIQLNFDSVKLDTSSINVFKETGNATLKIDYYHTDGYSYGNRYWYEVIVIDSLMILNFKSPSNSDWDYINYQKQTIIDDSIVNKLISIIKSTKIRQKKKGIPLPPASCYTSDKLFIETSDLKLAGGNVFINCGTDDTLREEKRMKLEKDFSSTIDGDYDLVINEIKSLFKELDFLLKDMKVE